MGSILNAICKNCGFAREGIFFGQGMRAAVPRVPAIRKASGEFVQAELSDDTDLRFYNDPSMYKNPIEEDEGIQDFDIWLNPKDNLCPACKEYAMDFEAYGNWD